MLEIKVKKKLGSFTVDVASHRRGRSHGSVRTLRRRQDIRNKHGCWAVSPDEGLIEVNGLKLFDSQRSVDLPPEQRRCGYVFQDGRLFPHLTVKSQPRLWYEARASCRALRELRPGRGTPRYRPSPGPQAGQAFRRRKAEGCHWPRSMTSPSLLLMDEPLASLDSAARERYCRSSLDFLASFPSPSCT